MPLLMVCLEGLGKLAQKFPNIASTSIYYLRDFLVAPSPILLKLYRQHSEYSTKEHQFKVLGIVSLLSRIIFINMLAIKLFLINITHVHIFLGSSREGNNRYETDNIISAYGIRETSRCSNRQSLYRFGSCAFRESGLRAGTRSQCLE